MAHKSNKIEYFWQELKRRKVLRVTATYAATAYIIVEVINNLIVPLHLPGWIATIIVLLLMIGLPIVVILSWFYDFTPKGIKKIESLEESEKKESLSKPVKRKLRPIYVLNAILIIVVIVLAYPRIFNRDKLENLRSSDGRISVAVMPFQNMTNDTTWNIWQAGIQNELIASLTNSEEIKVRQTETINSILQSKGLTNYASIIPSVANTISQKLDANVFVYGSIKQVGATIRLNAQLINSKTEEAFKSFQIDGTFENILHITDSLSVMVKNSLIISKLEKELPLYLQYNPSTTSSEAYRYYLKGLNARSKRDYPIARNLFLQALAIDSNFISATLALSYACTNQGDYLEARKWSNKAYAKRDQMPLWMKILIDQNHAFFYETPLNEIKYLRQYMEIDDQYPGTYYSIGLCYYNIDQYDKAIPEFEKALELYHKLDSKPWWIWDYAMLGNAYHKTGQYKKETKLYKKADQDFPNDPLLFYQKAILSLTEGDTITANKYIKKYISIRRDNSWSEAAIAYNLGELFSLTGNLEKAEEYHRQELSLEPDNPYRLWNLGWFLVNKDRNIDEGLKLIDKALELKPDLQWYCLDGKGWGLYKQGKYAESLELLEKCRDLSLYYRHEIQLHIEQVKKAIANQKNN
jgi:tetratricopeptide (TPR) repeat protein